MTDRKVGVIGDVHAQHTRLETIIPVLRELGAETIICTGTDKLLPTDTQFRREFEGSFLPEENTIRPFPIKMNPRPPGKTEKGTEAEEKNENIV